MTVQDRLKKLLIFHITPLIFPPALGWGFHHADHVCRWHSISVNKEIHKPFIGFSRTSTFSVGFAITHFTEMPLEFIRPLTVSLFR